MAEPGRFPVITSLPPAIASRDCPRGCARFAHWAPFEDRARKPIFGRRRPLGARPYRETEAMPARVPARCSLLAAGLADSRFGPRVPIRSESFATLFLGLVVILPVMDHAGSRGLCDAIRASVPASSFRCSDG